MAVTVTGPDGSEFEFPDDTPPETIKGAMQKHYGAPEAQEAPAAPAPKKRGILEAVASGVDDFARGIPRIPGAIARGAADTADNFGKGVQRIAEGDVGAQEAIDAASGVGRGIIKPFGGDTAIALMAKATGNEKPLGQLVNESKAKGEEIAADNPLGEVAGELYGVGKAAGALQAVKPLAVVKGAPLLQTGAKLAGQGALLSGASEFATTGDPSAAAKAAATGALTNPLAVGGITGVGKIAGGIGTMISKRGLSVLQNLGIDSEKLDGLFSAFVKANGRAPKNILEVLDDESTAKLNDVFKARPGAATAVAKEADRYAEELPDEAARLAQRLGPGKAVAEVTAPIEAAAGEAAAVRTARGEGAAQEAIAAGDADAALNERAAQQLGTDTAAELRGVAERTGKVTSRDQLVRERDAWATKQMNQIGDQLTDITGSRLKSVLNKDAAFRQLVKLRKNSTTNREEKRLTDALDALQDGDGTAQLTIRDLDNVRQALREQAARGGSDASLNRLAEVVQNAAGKAQPAYKKFLRGYASRSAQAEGLQFGATVRNAPSTDFRQNLRALNDPERAGAEQGALKAVADSATDAQGGVGLAKDLVEPAGELRGRLRSAAGQDVADELTRTAQGNLQGIEAHTAAAGTARENAKAIAKSAREVAGTEAAALKADAQALTTSAGRARGVLSTGSTEFADQTANARTQLPNDTSAIARAAIQDASRTDPAGAGALLQKLAKDRGVIENMKVALGTDDAAAAEAAAGSLLQGARNFVTLGSKAGPGAIEGQRKAINELGKTVASVVGKASGGLMANIVSGVVSQLKIPPGAAKKVAASLVSRDPVETAKALEILRKTGKLDATLDQLYRSLGLAFQADARYDVASENAQ